MIGDIDFPTFLYQLYLIMMQYYNKCYYKVRYLLLIMKKSTWNEQPELAAIKKRSQENEITTKTQSVVKISQNNKNPFLSNKEIPDL